MGIFPFSRLKKRVFYHESLIPYPSAFHKPKYLKAFSTSLNFSARTSKLIATLIFGIP